MTTPDPKAVDAEVRRMFGEVAAFLNHPELGPILRKAATEGWDASRLFGALQQTKYWRTTGDDARKWQILRSLDPATAKARIEQQTVAVAELARATALTYTPEQVRYFAELSLKNGWSPAQLKEHLLQRESTVAGGLDKNIAQNYGYLAAFLDNEEVGNLLKQGAREQWDMARLESELKNTEFFKTTTEAQRKWDALGELNPADAEQQRQARQADISALAQELGVSLSAERLAQIANDSLRYGWSQTQVRNSVTAEYEYGQGPAVTREQAQGARRGIQGPQDLIDNRKRAPQEGAPGPADPEFGVAGQTARQIREMAGQYLVPISEQMMERWTEQIIRGETDMEGFNGYLIEQAKSMFPGMANALDQGITVAQYADPYKQIAARELEIAPESIDLNDPRYRKMLDQRDSKGNRVAMTLSESAEYLRRLPEWQQTRGANEKAAAVTENLLRTFGAVA